MDTEHDKTYKVTAPRILFCWLIWCYTFKAINYGHVGALSYPDTSTKCKLLLPLTEHPEKQQQQQEQEQQGKNKIKKKTCKASM